MADDLTAALRSAFDDFTGEGNAPPLLSYAVFDRDRVCDVGSSKNGDPFQADDEPGRFRVASITKSFTAAAVLRLRDEGKLSLDDTASMHVPEISRWPIAPSLRDLLTMRGGLVTDNPWADRRQDLPVADFREWLADVSPTVCLPRGTFEYSNLGYALLGVVVSEVAQADYRAVMNDWFLEPLEMTDSTFAPDDDDQRIVTGFVWRGERWHAEPFVGDGAFSPMGGLFSTTADIARWAMFLASGFRGRGWGEHILSSLSRREMQTIQAPYRGIPERNVTEPDTTVARGYGFGLRVETESGLGTFAGHIGGYPGYGAHMWWHPGSGFGLVILANSTYAPVWNVTQPVLKTFVANHPGSGRPEHPSWLTAPRESVDGLIDNWSVRVARELFSDNVDADHPLNTLRDELVDMQRRHGPFGEAFGEEADTPGRIAWRRKGQEAEIAASLLLDPGSPPQVQHLTVELIPDLSDTRRRRLEDMIAAMDGRNLVWPADVRTASGFDGTRAMAITSLLYGPVTLDRVVSNKSNQLIARLATAAKGSLRLVMTFDDQDQVERFEVFWIGTAPVERPTGP